MKKETPAGNRMNPSAFKSHLQTAIDAVRNIESFYENILLMEKLVTPRDYQDCRVQYLTPLKEKLSSLEALGQRYIAVETK